MSPRSYTRYCPRCSGRGTTVYWHGPMGFQKPIHDTCGSCKGTGEVELCWGCNSQLDVCQCPSLSERAFLRAFELWWTYTALLEKERDNHYRMMLQQLAWRSRRRAWSIWDSRSW